METSKSCDEPLGEGGKVVRTAGDDILEEARGRRQD